MPRYTDLVVAGNTQTVTAETALTQSPYTPTVTGQLVNIIAITQTTTAAANGGYIRVKCTTFGGVDQIAPIFIATIAAGGANVPPEQLALADSVFCSLPIKAGVPVSIVLKYDAAPTSPLLDIFFTIIGS
jgi:hypothetical protein